jgi:hypothetical protein
MQKRIGQNLEGLVILRSPRVGEGGGDSKNKDPRTLIWWIWPTTKVIMNLAEADRKA